MMLKAIAGMEHDVMDRVLVSQCELDRYLIERGVHSQFDAHATLPGAGYLPTAPFIEAPYTGEKYWAGVDDYPIRQQVIRALSAAWTFHQEHPDWGILLPIRQKNCDLLRKADDVRLNLVGYYGESQLSECWNERHPHFHRFNCGFMACEKAPEEIRNDAGLKKQFPPCPLEGFSDDWLTWLSPDSWATHRKAVAMNAAHDAGNWDEVVALSHRDFSAESSPSQ